jgi:O-antigen/teichoic acid export membrane protein
VQIRRSLWITFAFSNASTAALFLVSLVLARILTPKEIGLFSICVVIMNLGGVLRDLGTGPYLISKNQVTPSDTGAVLGLTMTTSWVLAAMLYLSREHIAAYFGEPQMAEIIPILLIGFLLIPLAAIMNSLLTRNLSAGRSAFVSLFSTFVYGSVILTLATMGYGAKAPAWANAANLVANVASYWAMMPKGFRIWPRWSGWDEPLRYSGGVVLTNLANVGYQSLPDAVIGRTLGAHDVGLYSRGNGTVSLFTQVVGPTLNYNALPIIAKTFHQSSSELVGMVMRSAELLTVLAWPIYAWIAVFPKEIITLLYGPSWVEAAALAPWLCLAAAARAPFMIVGPALQAVNRPFIAAMASICGLVLRIVVLAIFGVKDLLQFVILLCAADVLAQVAWAYVGHKYLDLDVRKALYSQRRSLIVGLSCLVVAFAAHALLASTSLGPAATAALSGGAIAVAWLSSLVLAGHPFAQELKKAVAKVRGQDS